MLHHSRAKQARFAADRDWEKYHTPRNLLLALVRTAISMYYGQIYTSFFTQVGEVGELSELL